MEDVLDALQEAGWKLVPQRNAAGGYVDPFWLDGESIEWEIFHPEACHNFELKFCAFGDLGQRTYQLRDIFYCIVRETGQRLYFVKRNHPEWRENVATFIDDLEKSRLQRKERRKDDRA